LGWASYAAIYDSYRIMSITVHWLPKCNVARMDPVHYNGSAATQQPEALPTMAFGIDYNDANALDNTYWFEQILMMPQHHVSPLGAPITFKFVPQINRAVHATTSGTNYEMVPAPSVWLDTAGYSQYHYGVKWGYTTPEYSVSKLGFLISTAVVEFKSSKMSFATSLATPAPEPPVVAALPVKSDAKPDANSEYFLVRKEARKA